MLFVSFSLWKLTTFCIHCSPVAGLSGWMYILLGISGSALPATIHLLLWNLYLKSSAATTSSRRMYLALASRPDILNFICGNICLEEKEIFDILSADQSDVRNVLTMFEKQNITVGRFNGLC